MAPVFRVLHVEDLRPVLAEIAALVQAVAAHQVCRGHHLVAFLQLAHVGTAGFQACRDHSGTEAPGHSVRGLQLAHDKTLDFRVSACSAAGRISVYPDGMDKPSVVQEVGVVPPQVGAEGVAARPDNGKNYLAVAAVLQQAVAEGAGLLPVAVEGEMDSTDNKTEDSNTT